MGARLRISEPALFFCAVPVGPLSNAVGIFRVCQRRPNHVSVVECSGTANIKSRSSLAVLPQCSGVGTCP